jgi:ATP phosphoribosyltransferase
VITLALSKGRIQTEALPLLAACNIVPEEDIDRSRKLIIGTHRADVRLLIVRASDVPTYVQHGAADIGITGGDTLYEHTAGGLYSPIDLQIAKCRMVVACHRDFDYAKASQPGARLAVASKYVKLAREHFADKRMHIDLIKLYGSMELAPLTGLAQVIVDLVDTGNTLRANNLVAVEDIMPVTSKLVANPASMKLKRAKLQPLLEQIAEVVGLRKHEYDNK